VTREEQTERLRERMTNPKKFWKHKDEDWEFAKRRDEFLSIYEKLMRQCDAVPWKVVASDKNWYKEWLISKEVMQVLEEMKPEYPPLVTSMKK
jgi:polyphosphate kinase 2 (PPK2 family)